MKTTLLVFVLIILNACISQRPVSGIILDKQSKAAVVGAKVYNKAKSYENTISDSTGHFYFLCVRSFFDIRPLKIVVEKELYKPTQFKYRKIEERQIQMESVSQTNLEH